VQVVTNTDDNKDQRLLKIKTVNNWNLRILLACT